MTTALLIALSLTTAAPKAPAISPNAVRAFVYTWFAGFDENRPAADFASKLSSDVELKFPEATLKSAKDFEAWYATILTKYAKASHDITGLSVRRDGNHWYIEVDLRWHAIKIGGGEDSFDIHQSWDVIAEPAGLRIHRYSVTPL